MATEEKLISATVVHAQRGERGSGWRARWVRTGVPYLASVAMIAATLGGTLLLSQIGLSTPNVVMCFVLAVAFIAARFGTGPGITASIVSALILAYFFFPPIFSLAVSDVQNLVMMSVMITVALLISRLTDQVRWQARLAEQHAEQAEALYRLSADLAENSEGSLIDAASKQISLTFGGQAQLQINKATSSGAPSSVTTSTSAVTGDSPSLNETGPTYIMPLEVATQVIGSLRLDLPPESELSTDQRQLLAAFAQQIATAIERDRLTHQVRQVELKAEADRLRAALLSSVTHDLRTPLAIIAGASSSLIMSHAKLSPTMRLELFQTISDSSNRMARLIENLLSMTRLEAGHLSLHKEGQVLEEVIGAALREMKPLWHARTVRVELADDLPLVPLDAVLFQQLLLNLFENIQKYTPPASLVTISAHAEGGQCVIEIADEGPGVKPGDEQRIFEKFYRGSDIEASRSGVGLGLAICQAIAVAHGGAVTAQNRDQRGLKICIRLPLDDRRPLSLAAQNEFLQRDNEQEYVD